MFDIQHSNGDKNVSSGDFDHGNAQTELQHKTRLRGLQEQNAGQERKSDDAVAHDYTVTDFLNVSQ